jgi:tetratricopeptide (TPR) repeat protein
MKFKKLLLFCSILSFCFSTVAQEQNFAVANIPDSAPLKLFLPSTDDDKKIVMASKELTNYIEKLARKKERMKEEKFLRHVFYSTHKKFLKKYTINSPLHKTLETGVYDCVSGSALYGIILTELGIHYKIRETKFHVYIVTEVNNKTQLFETTDPLGGYVDDIIMVKEREELYDKQQERAENVYVYGDKINEEIKIVQLAGLEYYNQGIAEYNKKNILESLNYFEKALRLYNCPRIQEIFKMSLNALANEVKYTKSIGLARSYEYYTRLLSTQSSF